MLRHLLLVSVLVCASNSASAQVRTYEVQRYEIVVVDGQPGGQIRFDLKLRFSDSNRTESIGAFSLQELANWSELLRARLVTVEIDESGRKRFYFSATK